MRHRVWKVTLAAVAVLAISSAAFAQGGGVTASLSGVVVDTSGAILPGADVTVVNDATKGQFHAVTNAQGTFNIPSLDPGTYTVTVTMMGFKTKVLRDVVLNAGVPSSVRPEMEVGGLEEVIEVRGGSEIVQTQTAAISTTIDVNQISNLPLTNRNVLTFVTNLPGVSTPGGSRQSQINGLPRSSINITIDGMSAQDNFQMGQFAGDGFFARVVPRLDAIEEVTVSTAAQGAEATGHGAVQIRFTTRSGSNTFTGSSYYYLQHHRLNANTWFNNRNLAPDPATGKAPKPQNVLHQPGTRVGGPVVLPGLFDGRNKAFFFVNYEESRSPGALTRNRTILHPLAQQGIFRYEATGGQIREVDVLALAQSRGLLATVDPTVAGVLAAIRASTSGGSVNPLTNPIHEQLSWQVPTKGLTRYPTTRMDVNVTDRHRLSGSLNFTGLLSTPDTLNNRDPFFPGFSQVGAQHSDRYTLQTTLRSTITTNLVNELRIGRTGGATLFSPEIGPAWFSGATPDQGGFHLTLGAGLTNPSSNSNYAAREAGTRVVENTLSWMKGSHSMAIGVAFTRAVVWLENIQYVPHLTFGVAPGDPASSGMFTTANFPGASTTQLNQATALYALLTGRVNAINAATRLDEASDQYAYLGRSMQRASLDDWGFFISDTWRWTPNLTLNLGLRYELQTPFTSQNNSYSTSTYADVCGVSGVAPQGGCNLFQPGHMPGKLPEFQEFRKGSRAYNIDYNNFAPNLGINWVPSPNAGFFRTLLGAEGDTSFRMGYSLAYSRPGMADFTGLYGANPGVQITTNRTLGLGNLNQDGLGFPILLRERPRLGPPEFPLTRNYPMSPEATGSVNIFDPDLQVPYAQTWTAGWQRKLTRDIVGEIRYVGSRHVQGWTDYNFNETNIVENGFLTEFRNAQANLQANLAAGRGATIRYFGEGTGTHPLPTYLAHFTGSSQAGNPAAYTGNLWTNNTFINPLAIHNPQPVTAANALFNDATRRQNALDAGLPANHFVVNPHALGNARVRGNGGHTKYHALQTEVRKRLSHGFQFGANYTYGMGWGSNRFSFRTPRETRVDTGSPGNVVHAFKTNWIWELPFGRGRHFFTNAGGVLDRIVGGWAFDGVGRIQSGGQLNLGNVRLIGMSVKDVEKMFKLNFDHAGRVIYMLPQDVIEETVKAFGVSATSATGYGAQGPPSGRYFAPANGPDCIEIAPGSGECGQGQIVVRGPRQVRFDLSAVKRVRFVGRTTGEFRAEMLNAFNHPWFTGVTGYGTSSANNPNYATRDNYRVTGVGENSSRIVQLVFRFSW
jgi:hypothetical protein